MQMQIMIKMKEKWEKLLEYVSLFNFIDMLSLFIYSIATFNVPPRNTITQRFHGVTLTMIESFGLYAHGCLFEAWNETSLNITVLKQEDEDIATHDICLDLCEGDYDNILWEKPFPFDNADTSNITKL